MVNSVHMVGFTDPQKQLQVRKRDMWYHGEPSTPGCKARESQMALSGAKQASRPRIEEGWHEILGDKRHTNGQLSVVCMPSRL